MLRVNGALVRDSGGALLRSVDPPFLPTWLSTAPTLWLEASPTTMFNGSTPTTDGNVCNRLIRPGNTVLTETNIYATSANSPIAEIDGNGYWWLKATTDIAFPPSSNISIGSGDFTVWFVGYRVVSTSLVIMGTTSGNDFFGVYLDGGIYLISPVDSCIATYPGPNSTPCVWRIRRSSGTMYFQSSGTSEMVVPGSFTGTGYNLLFGRVDFGSYTQANNKIGLVVTMPGAHTAADQIGMNWYTQKFWGVSL